MKHARMLQMVLNGLVVIFFAAGCQVPEDKRSNRDTTDNQTQDTADQKQPEVSSDPDQCGKMAGRGCLFGQIVASPNIVLDGLSYFDAEELGQNLGRHLLWQLQEFGGGSGVSPEFVADQKVGNDNFTDNFIVYLKGADARRTRVDAQGRFDFRGLPTGWYEVRVQKELSFSARYPAASDDEDPKTQSYCGIIYGQVPEIFVTDAITQIPGIDAYRIKVLAGSCIGAG